MYLMIHSQVKKNVTASLNIVLFGTYVFGL